MTSIKSIAAVAFVALLVPVAAVAKETTIEGPQALAGSGFFGGELRQADDARPVKIVGRIAYVGVLDLGGDLRVACAGKGRVVAKQTEAGAVYLCRGSGQLLARGSHFVFRGFAGRYRAHFPDGTSGTFRQEPGARGEERPERGEGPERKEKAKEKIPTVQELAKLLAALQGGG